MRMLRFWLILNLAGLVSCANVKEPRAQPLQRLLGYIVRSGERGDARRSLRTSEVQTKSSSSVVRKAVQDENTRSQTLRHASVLPETKTSPESRETSTSQLQVCPDERGCTERDPKAALKLEGSMEKTRLRRRQRVRNRPAIQAAYSEGPADKQRSYVRVFCEYGETIRESESDGDQKEPTAATVKEEATTGLGNTEGVPAHTWSVKPLCVHASSKGAGESGRQKHTEPPQRKADEREKFLDLLAATDPRPGYGEIILDTVADTHSGPVTEAFHAWTSQQGGKSGSLQATQMREEATSSGTVPGRNAAKTQREAHAGESAAIFDHAANAAGLKVTETSSQAASLLGDVHSRQQRAEANSEPACAESSTIEGHHNGGISVPEGEPRMRWEQREVQQQDAAHIITAFLRTPVPCVYIMRPSAEETKGQGRQAHLQKGSESRADTAETTASANSSNSTFAVGECPPVVFKTAEAPREATREHRAREEKAAAPPLSEASEASPACRARENMTNMEAFDGSPRGGRQLLSTHIDTLVRAFLERGHTTLYVVNTPRATRPSRVPNAEEANNSAKSFSDKMSRGRHADRKDHAGGIGDTSWGQNGVDASRGKRSDQDSENRGRQRVGTDGFYEQPPPAAGEEAAGAPQDESKGPYKARGGGGGLVEAKEEVTRETKRPSELESHIEHMECGWQCKSGAADADLQASASSSPAGPAPSGSLRSRSRLPTISSEIDNLLSLLNPNHHLTEPITVEVGVARAGHVNYAAAQAVPQLGVRKYAEDELDRAGGSTTH